MESLKPAMPDVPDSERSPLVDALLEIIAWQQKRIEELEQQILKLKGETTKPKIMYSTVGHFINTCATKIRPTANATDQPITVRAHFQIPGYA